jgi:spore coat polysaccharide biosynthesis protein SpsF
MPKTIGCIIARTASRRLPKKVLRNIGDRKLIEHIISRVKRAKNIDKIYLCTSVDPDDEILISIAKDSGIYGYAGSREVVIDRMLNVADIENADNVIRITGDNIFCDEIFTDKMIELHNKHKADYTRTTSLPLGVTSEIFSVSGLKSMYSSIDRNQTEYLTYYVFFSENNLRKLILYPPATLRQPFYSLTVDTPEDFQRTLYIMEKLSDNNVIYLDDILNLNENASIPHLKIDRNIQIKFPNDMKKLYGDYLDELEDKYKSCIIVNLDEDFYEKDKIKRIN